MTWHIAEEHDYHGRGCPWCMHYPCPAFADLANVVRWLNHDLRDAGYRALRVASCTQYRLDRDRRTQWLQCRIYQ